MNPHDQAARGGAGQGDTPAKLALLEALKDTIPDGTRWALRGGKSGLAAWLAADTVKDLDLWVHSQDIRPFVRALAPIAVGTVSLESDPRWLRHLVLVMPQRFGGQLLDITYGDLRVGGALTCREALIQVRPGRYGPALSGVAAVSDLLMRKLLRGKTVSPNRLAESCLQWHSAPVGQREAWLGDLRATFNTALPDRVQAILSGRRITGFVRATFLLRAGWASLRDGGVPLAFRRRRRFVLGLRHRVLLKRPVAPVLFEVSGEEAAMLAAHIEMVLAGMGVTTQRVASVAVGPAALWRRGGRLIKAGLYGHAVILFASDETRLPWMARLCGKPILVDAHDGGGDIVKRYCLAAHRWYIDDPMLAGQFAGGESAMAERLLQAVSPLSSQPSHS